MRFCITFIVFLFSFSSPRAQQPLSVGDPVPDISFETVLHYSSGNAKLSHFKGKLIILDFWATWCSSCLHAFPKMDSLQQLFGDQLKVLLVNNKNTRDDLSKVQAFFEKWKARTGRPLSLTTIVNDTITEKLFPHQLIPHYVWIGKDGRVLAITSSEEVTAHNISSILNGDAPSFTMKKDQNTGRPIFTSADLPLSNLVNYAVLIKGWFEGLPSGNRIREKDGVICGRAMTNTSLLDMYLTVAKKMNASIDNKRVIVSTKDSADVFAPPPGSEERDSWYKAHAYSLDLIIPKEDADHLYERILQLLNQYSGYSAKFENRKIRCWVLVIKNAKNLKTKGGKEENRLWDQNKPFLQNQTIAALVNYLNSLSEIKKPVLDGTGFSGKLDMKFDQPFSDLRSVRQNLAQYGLELKEEQRVLKVFVIRNN